MARYTNINAAVPPVQGGQVPLSSYIGPGNVDLDEYPTHLANFALGGLQTFDSPGDRNLLPPAFRTEGMLAYVESDKNYYRLDADLITWLLLLQTGQSVANFIRRPFQNEIQLVFDNIPGAPLVQVYEQSAAVFRPALYSDLDSLVYGLSEYNQSNVAAERMTSHEQAAPAYEVLYLATQAQLIINFDSPRSGTAVLSF